MILQIAYSLVHNLCYLWNFNSKIISMSIFGSLLGGVGSAILGGFQSGVGTAVGNAVSGNLSTKDFMSTQLKNQQTLNKEAFDRQIEFWNMQNEYNLPSAVVQRLREAGLNPALAYGGSSVTPAGQLSNVNAGSAGGSSRSNIDPATASVIRLNDAQAELAEERADTEGHQRRLLDSTASLNDANVIGVKLHNEYQRIVNEIADATKEVTTQKALADLNQTLAFTDKLRVEQQSEKFKALHTEASIKKIDDEIKVLQSQAALNVVTAALRHSGIRLNEAQITSIEALTRVNNAEALFKEALNDNNYADSVVFKSWTDSVHNISGSAAQVINSVWDIVKVFVPASKRTEVTNVLREMFDANGNPKGVVTTQTTTVK